MLESLPIRNAAPESSEDTDPELPPLIGAATDDPPVWAGAMTAKEYRLAKNAAQLAELLAWALEPIEERAADVGLSPGDAFKLEKARVLLAKVGAR